jgi:hypothetical protein
MTDTCKNRISEEWENTCKDWEEHKNDNTYLNESFILSVDKVEPNTFENQKKGYKRIQFSWGGPSDELRVFEKYGNIDRIEYWFLDWFDGASIDVSNDKTAQDIVDYYNQA